MPSSLWGTPPRLMERVLKRKDKLPMREPIGCRPPPPEWPVVPSRFHSQEEATDTWRQLVTCMEEELLAVHGILGEEARKFKGRAKGPVWQVRPCRVVQGPERAGHNPECRAWRWLARTSGELLRLYRCMRHADVAGAKEEASCQEKQAQGLRGAVWKGLWQEKNVKEEVRQLWTVVARSLGRKQWAKETEWGLLEDVWQVAENGQRAMRMRPP